MMAIKTLLQLRSATTPTRPTVNKLYQSEKVLRGMLMDVDNKNKWESVFGLRKEVHIKTTIIKQD